jgi:hypothetical protein
MDELDSIAEIQKNRINEALDRNEERLENITHESQLILSISRYFESNPPLELEKINSILEEKLNIELPVKETLSSKDRSKGADR